MKSFNMNICSSFNQINSDLLDFDIATLGHGECDVDGYENLGLCIKCGKFIIIKACFAGMYFTSGATMFIVPEGFRPPRAVSVLISCIRDPFTYKTKETNLMNCDVQPNGLICQRFNSEATATVWTGEIFAVYSL